MARVMSMRMIASAEISASGHVDLDAVGARSWIKFPRRIGGPLAFPSLATSCRFWVARRPGTRMRSDA
jgi:hypothetical protein